MEVGEGQENQEGSSGDHEGSVTSQGLAPLSDPTFTEYIGARYRRLGSDQPILLIFIGYPSRNRCFQVLKHHFQG